MDKVLGEELRRRRQQILASIQSMGAQGLLVYATDGRGYNLRYLTNFSPIFGDAFLVMTRDRIVYLLNFNWEIPRAREASRIDEFIPTFDLVGQVTGIIRDLGIARGRLATVGFDRIPHPLYVALTEQNPALEFVDVTPVIERARRIKSPYEVAQLRRAVEVTDAALQAVRDALRSGLSEAEVAALADETMKAHGASELAFPTCVVSGRERAMPVGLPTQRKLQAGDVVMVDVGATWGGYHADMTRTYVVGKPTDEQQMAWDVVLQAWEKVVDEIRPGVPCRRLHAVARESIESKGYKLVHRIGHGIGLHTSLEWPNLETDEELLEPGMTFCIEPGIYISGLGSFKLEDDFVVTEDGFEMLSHADRTLA